MSESDLKKLKIGFEVHAQIKTRQKLYCDCSTDYQNSEPNRNICPVCYGLPGNKPMPINQNALNTAIEIALMLGSKVVIGKEIYVQRKHYNYPDLPNGYQKTSTPIATGGRFLNVGITEVHIEDDPGRYELSKGKVDYNRSGVPLIEVVTDPDIRTIEEAKNFWNELTKMLVYTGKIREEPGTIRSDTNISIGGERVEIKNINSSAGVYHALLYEVKRQLKLIKRGMYIKRETRGFLEDKMITVSLRTKEGIADYRYMPDPDIPPILISEEMVKVISKNLTESPIDKKNRLVAEYGINIEQAKILASDQGLSEMFEGVSRKVNPQVAASWITRDLREYINTKDIRLQDIPISQDDMIKLLLELEDGKITSFMAKDILLKFLNEGHDINQYLSSSTSVLDTDELSKIIESVIMRNKKAISEYVSGNKKVLNNILGQIIKETGGRVNPRFAAEKLEMRLKQFITKE